MVDAEIIEKAKHSDQAAWGYLVATYNPLIKRMARRVLRDSGEVEDASQATWTQVVKALPAFRGDSAFATWAGRIAINEALTIVRKRRGDTQLASSPDFLTVRGDQDARAATRDAQHLLRRLPAHYREVVQKVKIQQLGIEETAAQLGLTAECVKGRLCRAMKAMRAAAGV